MVVIPSVSPLGSLHVPASFLSLPSSAVESTPGSPCHGRACSFNSQDEASSAEAPILRMADRLHRFHCSLQCELTFPQEWSPYHFLDALTDPPFTRLKGIYTYRRPNIQDGFGYGAVVPVLPFSLVKRSGVPKKDVQFWLSTLLVAFGLSLTLAAPITAWGGDTLGNRRIPMILGSLLALVGTAVFCVAEAPWLLVVARLCQGASNGAVYSAGLPLIADTVSPAEVGSGMGFVFSGMTGGFLVSPFLAGIVYAKAGYLPVFILVFASLGFDLFLRIIIIEGKTRARSISDEGHRERYKATPNESSPRLRNSSLTGNNHSESDLAEDSDGEHRSSGSSTVNGTPPEEPPKGEDPSDLRI
ncbi:MAG: hypothetical protein Q9228_002664 [Teloschistes exilis]